MNPFKKPLAGVGSLALVAGLVAAVPATADDRDDATARAAWQAFYYDEVHNPTPVPAPGRSGAHRHKVFSPAFRAAMLDAARNEALKYPALMPSAEGTSSTTTMSTTAATTTGTWTNIGPTKADVEKNGSYSLNVSDSGRPVDIVTHPTNASVLYVAMSGGGVWKTTNGGASWTPMTETLGSLSCGALALDQASPDTLYLGLGDAFDGTGIGFLKSTDGGLTWSAPIYLGDSTIINDVFVVDSNTVLAGTNKGLYRSTNAGATFSKIAIATGQTVDPYVWNFASGGGTSVVMTLEANHDAASGTTGGQIWRSTNGGAAWTQATGVTKTTGVGRMFVASAPSNRNTMYAEAAVPNATSATDLADFFMSTNGGVSWTALGATGRKIRYTNSNTESTGPSTLLNGQGWYNQLVMVNPNDPNTAYFGGALLLARRNSSGSYTQMSNWLAQFSLPYVHADFHAGAFGPDGAMYVGTDGGVFKSTDNGTTWTSSLNVGITSHLIYSVGSSPNNAAAVIGGFQDNGTRVRSGSTSTFNQYIGGDGFGSNVNRTNAQQMLGSLYYSRIYKSTDGGLTFASACSGITECNNSSSAPFNTHITQWLGDASGNTVYTFSNTKVYKSMNYAGSWTALGTSGLPTGLYIRNVGVAKSSASYVGVAANSGRVFLSSNGGTSWTLAASTPNNGLSMNSVWFDITNPATVYVSSVAADSTKNHLWKSTNSGASWTVIENGLPAGAPVNAVIGDPISAGTLYAATHLGVYQSTDAGATWTRFGSVLPLVNVTDLYVDSSLLRASTFGRGFWEMIP